MQKSVMRNIAALIGAASFLLLTGCMSSTNPDTYNANDAGMAAIVQHGIITDIRAVKLEGSKVGGPVGAAAGGIGGSYIGGDTRTSMLGALGGAVIGGVAGHYAGQAMTSRDGLQYIIQTTNKKTIAVVQGKEPVLFKGQHVLILTDKNKTRVIADDDYPMPQTTPSTSTTPSTAAAKK
ncbi:MAG: pcp [Gammaproteobacteria bacterium]|jgi:outer membrane lipoprotein SlyB|nr:pcp [Gammaproteobacteria bacterium]